MTKKEIIAKLKAANIPHKAKASKAELEALLADAKATKPKFTNIKRGPSAKAVIRESFPRVGVTMTKEALLAKLAHVKPETVVTMISDLRNPKYAGKAGVIDIQSDGDAYRRVK